MRDEMRRKGGMGRGCAYVRIIMREIPVDMDIEGGRVYGYVIGWVSLSWMFSTI